MYALMFVAVMAFGNDTETVRVNEVQYSLEQCSEVGEAFADELYANTVSAGGKIVVSKIECKPL